MYNQVTLGLSFYFLRRPFCDYLIFRHAVEEVRPALNEHAHVVAELFGRVPSDLRSGFAPAVDSFLGFFYAVDWKEHWLISMLSFHAILLLVTNISRRNVNFQLIISALTFSGVFLAERLNTFLGQNWKSFSSQNYFDPQCLFISVVWSGPPILITILILVNTLLTLPADGKMEEGRTQASCSPG